MRAADAAALARSTSPCSSAGPGRAVALAALRLLGGAYGRRIVVVAGKGNNGNDGRVAADAAWPGGARVVDVLDAAIAPGRARPLRPGDRRRLRHRVPRAPTTPRPSTRGRAGAGRRHPLGGRRRHRRGLGPGRCAADADGDLRRAQARSPAWGTGRGWPATVRVADIGVPVGHPPDRPGRGRRRGRPLPARHGHAHKWAERGGRGGRVARAWRVPRSLCARGASHAGAGMVRLARPGADDRRGGPWPLEAVAALPPRAGWADDVLAVLDRCRALVVGPGLGRDERDAEAEVRRWSSRARRCRWWSTPTRCSPSATPTSGARGRRRRGVDRPVVLTPHDGEYRRLAGDAPGPDRVAAARRLAEATGAVVLLKGSLTAVAAPAGADGREPDVLLAAAGTPVLATAGTGRRAVRDHRGVRRPRRSAACGGRAGGPRPRRARPERGRPRGSWPATCPTSWPPGSRTAGSTGRWSERAGAARPGPRSTSTRCATTSRLLARVRRRPCCVRWSRPTPTATVRSRWPRRPLEARRGRAWPSPSSTRGSSCATPGSRRRSSCSPSRRPDAAEDAVAARLDADALQRGRSGGPRARPPVRWGAGGRAREGRHRHAPGRARAGTCRRLRRRGHTVEPGLTLEGLLDAPRGGRRRRRRGPRVHRAPALAVRAAPRGPRGAGDPPGGAPRRQLGRGDRLPGSRYDLVRTGIALYGELPTPSMAGALAAAGAASARATGPVAPVPGRRRAPPRRGRAPLLRPGSGRCPAPLVGGDRAGRLRRRRAAPALRGGRRGADRRTAPSAGRHGHDGPDHGRLRARGDVSRRATRSC